MTLMTLITVSSLFCNDVYLQQLTGEMVILQRFLTATGIIHALSQLILHAFLQHLNQYTWTGTVQYLCRVKKISMTCNVLSLHFTPSQASSSQNSNVGNFLPDCHNPFEIPFKVLRPLPSQLLLQFPQFPPT